MEFHVVDHSSSPMTKTQSVQCGHGNSKAAIPCRVYTVLPCIQNNDLQV